MYSSFQIVRNLLASIYLYVSVILLLSFPVLGIIVARLLQPRRPRNPRTFPALLLSTLWCLTTLLLLQRLNLFFGWWTFTLSGPSICGMPVELYLGWIILWALIPQLVFPMLDLPEVLAIMVIVDIFLTPLHPDVHYRHQAWWVGEFVGLAIVFIPSWLLTRWTLANTHLNFRATLQVILSGLLFLYFVPELVFALHPASFSIFTQHFPSSIFNSSGWSVLLNLHPTPRQVIIQILLLLAVPGVSAVQEFAQRGHGTPIPYDPPQLLVTSGIYRYCANPMQFSCAIVMLSWAFVLQSFWLVVASIVSIIYSVGLATWDEHTDLALRFGTPWKLYRAAVPAWRLRWRPYHAGPPAQLFIARTCGPCSQLRRWLENRSPLGLIFLDAESLPAGSITRLRYDPADGSPSVDGIRAFARALEHLNLAWAYCGITLRLPIVWQCFQLFTDSVGLGPRKLPSTCPQ